jgi:hypothetical protein
MSSALRTPTIALTAAAAIAADAAIAALTSASARLLQERTRCYFAMLAGNAVLERPTSYKDYEKWVETVKMYKYYQENANLPELVDLLKVNDPPSDVEWETIKVNNMTWANAKQDNVSYYFDDEYKNKTFINLPFSSHS